MLSKQCLQCEKTIYKKDNCSLLCWNSRVKYCSVKCSNTFRRGKSFTNSGSFKKGHELFANDTRKKRCGANNNLWRGGMKSLTCKICSTEFLAEPYELSKRKFCSAPCRREWEKSPEYRLAMSEVHRERVAKGLHNLYRGIAQVKKDIRHCLQYRLWRESVFKRDNYRCQFCGIQGEMNADHIKSFGVILLENDIKTLEQALNCAELWDVNNGRTLCVPCHKKTESFGRFTMAFINLKVETKNNT